MDSIDDEVILLDAEDEDGNAFQVNYYLLFLVPVVLGLMKIFSNLSTWIATLFFRPGPTEHIKTAESRQITDLMESLSMVNDFATYSKLQRKLNMLTLDLEAEALSRKALRADLARMLRFGMYAVVGISYVVVLCSYGTQVPVMVLPSDWYFPLGFLLSYPTGVPGAVSLPVWTLIVRTLSQSFFK